MSTTLSRSLVSQVNLANSRWYVPHLFSHLVPSEATDDEVTLIHFHGRAGGEPPLHIHSQEDEFFYILEGDFVFEAGNRQMQGKPGTFIWFPKDVEHGFKAYTSTGKGLIGFLPGKMQEWFYEFSTPAEFLNLPPAGAPSYLENIEAMMRSGNARGVEFLPPTTTSTKANPSALSQPFARHRDSAEKIALGGMAISLLAGTDQTGGVLTAFEGTVDPGVSVPLHIKTETEIVYVLDGQARYQLGDTLVEVGPGTSLLVPAGTPSGYRNVGPAPSRVLHIICGGPFEKLCREVQPLLGDPEANFEQIGATLQTYGWKLIAPEIAG